MAGADLHVSQSHRWPILVYSARHIALNGAWVSDHIDRPADSGGHDALLDVRRPL